MKNEIYVVEWLPADFYGDCNAVFSTVEKGFAYIEKELERMNLENTHMEPTTLGIDNNWFSIDFRSKTDNTKGYVLCSKYLIDAEETK